MSEPPAGAGTPRAAQRLRQDRPGGPGPRAARGRRRAGVDRLDGGADRRHRGAGHAGRGAHRLPGVPRRAGEDAAPARCTRASSPTGGGTTTCSSSPTSASRPFDLVVVNLYPFRETVASGAGTDEVVEQIDIGGPSMVRAAAKNHPSVAVVVDPTSYDEVLAAVQAGGFDLAARRRLAAQAFAHTAAYDTAVAAWCQQELTSDPQGWPPYAGLALERAGVLRYGENPHQQAALYVDQARGPRHRPGHRAARQGDVLQQLRRRRRRAADRVRLRPAGRRDHQAHQPVRHRGRRRHRRGARGGARLRPGVRVRWRGGGQPPGHPGDGRAAGRGVHRGGGGAVVRRGRVRPALPEEERAAARAARRAPARRRRAAPGVGRRARRRPRTGSTPTATTRRPGRWPRASRPTTPCSPTWPSPGGPAGR